MPLKVASLGYVGFGNLGDEAVLAGVRSALAGQAPFRDAQWTVLSADPGSTRRLHPEVVPVSRWSWRESAAALRGTDLFILGGGSLFQDATSVRSVLWYAAMAWIARRRSKRVLWWGQGIGPLGSSVSRKVVAASASRADALTVRDSESARLLKDCGFSGSIELVADPAFLLTPPTPRRDRRGTLAALRRWRGMVPEIPMTSLPGPALGLPMHVPVDEKLVPGLPDLDWSGSDKPWSEVLKRLGSAELVIAGRLHAAILATVCATPFLALSYDPKVDALARRTRQEDMLVPIESCEPDVLRERMELLRSQWASRSKTLADVASEMREQARKPANMAAQWWS